MRLTNRGEAFGILEIFSIELDRKRDLDFFASCNFRSEPAPPQEAGANFWMRYLFDLR
jgi:hypothetical protein